MDDKEKKRIVLRSDQQTTIAISLARAGKTKVEYGDTVSVESTRVGLLSAQFNPVNHLVEVVPLDKAIGDADVVVKVTLADGTILPPQTVRYTMPDPDAEALVLTSGAITTKTKILDQPQFNAAPHILPEKPVAPVKPPQP